jgi:hypothetical protein
MYKRNHEEDCEISDDLGDNAEVSIIEADNRNLADRL